MARVLKKLSVWIFIVAGVVALLLSGFSAYFHTDSGQHHIQKAINSNIPGSIAFENLRFSLLKGTLELRNLCLTDARGDEIAGFDRLSVDISWRSVFTGDLRVSVLVAENPWARLSEDTEGHLNILRALSESGGGDRTERKVSAKESGHRLPLNLIIDRCDLSGGSMRFEREAQGLKAVIQEISLSAHGNLLRQSGGVRVALGHGSVQTQGLNTRFDRCMLEARVREGSVDPLTIQIKSDLTDFSLSGTIKNTFTEPVLNLRAVSSTSLSKIRESAGIKEDLTGTARANVTVQGAPHNPDVLLNLIYDGGVIVDNRIDGIVCDLRLSDRLLTFDNCTLKAAKGLLSIKGKANLRDAFPKGFLSPERNLNALRYELTLKEDGIQMDTLRTDNTYMRGSVRAHLVLRGSGIHPRSADSSASIDISAENFSVTPSAHPLDLTVKGKGVIERGIMKVERLKMKVGSSVVDTSGEIHLVSKAVRGGLTLTMPDLSNTLVPLGIMNSDGSATLNASIAGSFTHPRITFDLVGNKLRHGDMTLGDVRVNAELDESGLLVIRECAVKNKDSTILIKGSLAIFKPETLQFADTLSFQAQVEGPRIFLENFTKRMRGKLSLNASFQGTLQKPTGILKLNGENITLGDQRIDEIQLSAVADGEKIWIRPLQVCLVPGELIECNGWISPTGQYQISLMSGGISLHNIESIRKLETLKGRVLLNASGEGDINNPALKGNLVVKDVSIRGRRMDAFRLDFSFQDHIARIAGKLNFDVSGLYHMRKKDFSVSILCEETDLSPYFAIAGQSDLSGKMSGRIEANGSPMSVRDLIARIDMSKVELFYKKRKIVESSNLKLSLKDQEILIPRSALLFSKNEQLIIEGKGRLDGSLYLRTEGKIPLRIAEAFTDEIADTMGNLLLSSTVEGDLRKPVVRATVGLEGIGCTIPSLSQKLRDISGRVMITPGAITFEQVRGKLNTGVFLLTGTITLKDFQPHTSAITFRADAVPVGIPDTMDMVLSAELRIEGGRGKSKVSGEITILEGTYYRDVDVSLLDMVMEKKREEAPIKKEVVHPFLENMNVDIVIRRRNPVVVDNNLAKLDISPDLRLTGNITSPIIRGRATVEAGSINYQRKSFVVKKGIIDFVNPYKIDPLFDIESEVKVREWLIYLNVSGTREQLIFTLTSNPPEEHGDILSLLLIGRTTRELIAGEGGTSKSAEQILAEMVAATFGGDIKNATGLDIFEVSTTDTGNEETADSLRMTVGKELSERTTVKYSVETKKGEIVQRAVAEYKFLENVLVSGFQDTQGVFGGQLKFRLEFR